MDKEINNLIHQYSVDLSRLCRSMCKSEADAEDLFQTTWEKVIKNIHKYKPEKPFDKWLFAVCINAHRDMLRNPFRKHIASFDKSEELQQILNSIPDSKADADEYIALHNAINKLDTKKRQAIALYYFKDYSTAELAQILGVPEGTVKSRLSAARDQIRKELINEHQ